MSSNSWARSDWRPSAVPPRRLPPRCVPRFGSGRRSSSAPGSRRSRREANPTAVTEGLTIPLRRRSNASMEISKLSNALGAEVTGVDLARLSDSEFDRIEQAWHDHLLLVFRAQNLDYSQYIA